MAYNERQIFLPEISEHANQPSGYNFPKRSFGKTKPVHRAFQQPWFGKWKWLHYDSANDLCFCHTCVSTVKTGKMKLFGNVKDSAFLSEGFSNWKDATVGFANHEKSTTHKRAVEVVVTLSQTHRDVGELLSTSHASEKAMNRQCLMKIAQNIRFLARQGLSLRGDGAEDNSNFNQLLHLRVLDDPDLLTWVQRKAEKYTSPENQNELLKIMAQSVTRDIASTVGSSGFYTLMADEVTDASNIEQVAICLRSIDDNFDAHEDFVGMYAVESIKADILVQVLKDTLLRMNLPITNCRGQCYDGAANMAGARHGVAAQILLEEPRATFTHCYGHALNLAAGDTIKKNKILRNTLDVTLEISKLIKFSPRRNAIFQKLKTALAPETPGFRTLCPTRWTVRAVSLQSVIDNFAVLQELWDEALDVSTDSEARARIGGVKANMKTFDFVFGLVLGQRLLAHTDNLSKTMQSPKMTASEAQHVADLTCQTLLKMRDDTHFDLFWQFVTQVQEKYDISTPVLPHIRKVPASFEIGSSHVEHPCTVQDVYRPIYFECIDYIVSCIHDRFNQPGYIQLLKLENILVKQSSQESVLIRTSGYCFGVLWK